jgi:hypothetical protein
MKENLETETESGSELTSSVERLAARIGARAASVFGEPIERGSVTIVPVANTVPKN